METQLGLCLIGSEGWRHMRSYFDFLPRHARRVLSESKYNICAACFYGALQATMESPEIILRAFERAVEGDDRELSNLRYGRSSREHDDYVMERERVRMIQASNL